MCDVLREDETKRRFDEILPGVFIAEHPIRVPHQVLCTVLDDEITISSQNMTNMCNHVFQYMHACSTLVDIGNIFILLI